MVARDKLSQAIMELLEEKKTIPLREATQMLTGKKLGSSETVRKRLADLDGTVLKRVRDGRSVLLYQLEFFRRQGEISLEVRVSHAQRLKPVLEALIGEIPVIDDHGVQPAKNGVAPRVVGATPERYDPKELMGSEREGLFRDLMYHLDLIEPGSRPAVSTRLAAFKEQVSQLQLAQDALWDACKAWTAAALGLHYFDRWVDHGFSDTFPRLLYDHTLAAHRKDTRKTRFLAEDREVVATRVKNRIEVGWGAEALFQHRIQRGVTEEGLEKKAKGVIGRLPQEGRSAAFQPLAERVDAEMRRAVEMREILLSMLRDARDYEAYEGACKYVLPAQ